MEEKKLTTGQLIRGLKCRNKSKTILDDACEDCFFCDGYACFREEAVYAAEDFILTHRKSEDEIVSRL